MSVYTPEPIPPCGYRPGDAVIVRALTLGNPVHATVERVDRDPEWGDTLIVATPGDRWQVGAGRVQPHTPGTCTLDTHCPAQCKGLAA